MFIPKSFILLEKKVLEEITPPDLTKSLCLPNFKACLWELFQQMFAVCGIIMFSLNCFCLKMFSVKLRFIGKK